jgi:hypothetical protein
LGHLPLTHASVNQACLYGRISHHHKMRRLEVVSAGGPAGDVDEPIEQIGGDRIGFEIARAATRFYERFEVVEIGHIRLPLLRAIRKNGKMRSANRHELARIFRNRILPFFVRIRVIRANSCSVFAGQLAACMGFGA